MKTMMRNGKIIRRGVSLLLMVSLLISLLPATSVAETTVGAYGSVTVTTKNVVIRTSPAGARTGYFAQKGTYPMIGPAAEVDGVMWYNLQTSATGGFVSGDYAIANYGTAGMPSTDMTYVNIQANVLAYKGEATTGYNHADPTLQAKILAADFPILQLEDGKPYTVDGVQYINLYYLNTIYHTKYTNNIANGIMTEANLDTYITETTWKSSVASTFSRAKGATGDYMTHAIQAALYILSYYDEAIDGVYGTDTAQAVMDFRKDNSIGISSNPTADQAVVSQLFDQATDMIAYIRSNPGLGGGGGGDTPSTLIQTTVNNLRIRKSYTTSSAYVGMVFESGTILPYTRTHLNGTVTWYYIQFNGTYGWVMGTYVQPYTEGGGGSGGGGDDPITYWGTVTITKKLVAIRTSPNGARSGYHVNTGDVCTMIGGASEAGGYTWYHIRTENGREGYVRGDCAVAEFGSAGMPETSKRYVQFLYDDMKISQGSDPAHATGIDIKVPKNTVLQLVTGASYTPAGGTVSYINVYYDNNIYHTKYNNALIKGMMSNDNANSYIINTIWAQGLGANEICGNNDQLYIRTGDIRVHAIQAALFQLDYLDKTDDYDGVFGSTTADAVYKFESDYSLTKNKLIDSTDSVTLFTAAKAALDAKLSAGGGEDTGDGTVPGAGNFGTVNTVKKGSWAEIDGGATSLFPKGTVATVMSVTNPSKVFRLYRWSGANHADCVPYDTSDTATISSLMGVSYTGAPSSSELSYVISSGNEDWPSYTWPKFRWAGSTQTTGGAYKIPVWVNLNGTVYCASIYIIPHGFTGVNTSGFTSAKLNGQYFHERNNMYGMLCVHFYGSTTHSSGNVDATHMANINTAYNKAASQFGSSKVQ